MHHLNGQGKGKGWGLLVTLVAVLALFLVKSAIKVDVAHAANGEVSVAAGTGFTDCAEGDKGTTCIAPLGGTFHLRGQVDVAPGSTYSAFGLRLQLDHAGLVFKNVSPKSGDAGGGWPQCTTPLAAGGNGSTFFLAGCATSTPSTWDKTTDPAGNGFVVDWTFNCTATADTFVLTMPVGAGLNSNFSDPAGNIVVPKDGGDPLTVNCAVAASPTPPPPTNTPTRTNTPTVTRTPTNTPAATNTPTSVSEEEVTATPTARIGLRPAPAAPGVPGAVEEAPGAITPGVPAPEEGELPTALPPTGTGSGGGLPVASLAWVLIVSLSLTGMAASLYYRQRRT